VAEDPETYLRLVAEATIRQAHADQGARRYGVNSIASCWLVDDSRQWHIAMAGDWSSDGQVCDMTHLTVFPPVPRTASEIEIVTAGEAIEVRVGAQLTWWAP
jgi:hypothetical protein